MGQARRKSIRFHVPFTVTAPAMVSDAVGIARIRQHGPRPLEEITVIDAPDNRLLRAGVAVAHHVCDGRGEWSLAAPSWAPRLPARRVEPVDASMELPDEFARLVRPLARGALLGPVALLSVDRQQFSLLDGGDEPLAVIDDEQVTVRRGGVTTARYREVTISPSKHLTPQQAEFIIDSMETVSATFVDRFPTLQQRLGPPATGLTDFPEPEPVPRDATMEELVVSVFARDLQDLVESVLDLEAGAVDDVTPVKAQLALVRRDVRGLAHVLEPAWCESVLTHVGPVPTEDRGDVVAAALAVVDALVGAVHAPRLGDTSHEPAGELLFRRAEKGIYILADRCRGLEQDSPDPQWESGLLAAEQLTLAAGVAAALPSRPVAKILRLLDEITVHLRECLAAPEVIDVDDLSPAEAFQLGRVTERHQLGVARARAMFVRQWPDRVAKLRKLLARAKARLR